MSGPSAIVFRAMSISVGRVTRARRDKGEGERILSDVRTAGVEEESVRSEGKAEVEARFTRKYTASTVLHGSAPPNSPSFNRLQKKACNTWVHVP